MYAVDVEFTEGLSPAQRAVFAGAAGRWAEAIVGDVPDVMIDGRRIDDILIAASGTAIDGPGGILGQATFTHLRTGSFLPARGFMQFDSADLDNLEADGSLRDVILHEMGHVVGLGTIWERLGLVRDLDTDDPVFTGPNARREYAALLGEDTPRDVPLANTGGPGTRNSHLRESVFGDELMTGFISGTERPLSRVSIAILEDMGYAVDYAAADPYRLPTPAEISALMARPHRMCEVCTPAEPIMVQPLEDG